MESLFRPATPFSDPLAVEAWDAWFRWRDGKRVHDADVAATWRRVARALAAVERAAVAFWEREFLEAMRAMRVLPDPRVLVAAGTGAVGWPADELSAAVNVAALVRDPFSAQARLDLADVLGAAAIAVRMLDDALLLAEPEPREPKRLAVGVIGFADALLMLGHAYDSAAARSQAQLVAAALATGTHRASEQLRAERGVPHACDCSEQPCDGLHVAETRHARLTAITHQPRLALLANNVADAIEPLQPVRAHEIDARILRSPGSTLTRYPRNGDGARARDTAIAATPAAESALRAAMQPWIDAPIA